MFGFFTNMTQNQVDSINKRLDQLEKTQQLILKNQVLLDKNNKIRTDRLDRLLNAVLLRLGPKPEVKFVNVEELEMSKFKGDIILPPPSAPDVAKGGKRRVTVTTSAGSDNVLVDGDVLVLADVIYPQDERVTVVLVDIDDAGNESPASVAEFVVKDEIAPPQPGAIGFVIKEEIFDEEPVVDVPVAEVPVVDMPVVDVPVVDAPVAEVPVVDAPVAEVPVVDAPVAEEPIAEVTSDEEIQPE